MRNLTMEKQEEAIRLLKTMHQRVMRYAASHAKDSTAPASHRLHDSLALADIAEEVREFIVELDDSPERIEYQLHLARYLEWLEESPRLSSGEKRTANLAYETETSPERCAQLIAESRRLERNRVDQTIPTTGETDATVQSKQE